MVCAAVKDEWFGTRPLLLQPPTAYSLNSKPEPANRHGAAPLELPKTKNFTQISLPTSDLDKYEFEMSELWGRKHP